MPLTPNLSMNRPTHGSYVNTWDDPVNQNWDILDALFSGSAPPGHKHDGNPGQGPQIDHDDLLNKGTKTHADLDTAYEKTKVSSGDTTADFLESKIVAGANITITKLNPGGNEQLEIAATGGGGGGWTPDDEYGAVHTVTTSAPVAYTDNFTYPNGFTLRQADYAVQRWSSGGVVLPDFFATGFSAALYVDPSQGDDKIGKYAATVACQIPHGVAQRATCGVTDINYNDLVPGDYVSFTMSVFSTHRIGAAFPQKHGLLLELHLTCLSPGVFQMSHRVILLPDTTTQVLLYQHHHSNPDDMKGAWELSLDSNGHVYHYWRRKMVYSSQTIPPTTPGPVQAYIATLMASLLADGDEKYGAMGFGFHYNISKDSKFNFEFRWLTVTSDSDIYDEIVSCPGTADPYGVVDITRVPEEFFFATAKFPGEECCPAPDARNVGDILETDSDGNPTVWISEACEYYSDLAADGVVKGYRTNVSPRCIPCPSPSGDPSAIQIFDLTGDWPKEGTTGKIVLHGVYDIPPLLALSSTNVYFSIIDAVWLSYEELEIKYEIIDGGGGTDIDLTITNSVDPTKTYTIPVLDTIETIEPQILSATWLDTYLYNLTEPTLGYRFDATFTCKGVKPGTILSTSTPGVVINSFTVVSPTQITADITFPFDSSGITATFSLDPSGTSTLDYDVPVVMPTPVVSWVEFTAPAPPDGPQIGTGRAVTIHGNFFAGMPPTYMTIDVVDGTQVANFTVVSVTQTEIQVTFDVVGLGLVTPLLEFTIKNIENVIVVTIPVCVIGDSTLLSLSPPVVPDPTVIFNAGRKTLGGGYPPNYVDTVVAAGMNESVWILLDGLAAGPVWLTPGDVHTFARGPLGVQGEFWTICGENMFVDVTVIKPGVDVKAIIGAFPVADPPSPVTPSGAPAFSTNPEPGSTGTVDFLFSANQTYLTDVVSITETGSGSDIPGITLTNRTEIPGGLRYNFTISSDVAANLSVDIKFNNGECDPAVGTFTFTTEYPAPVIDELFCFDLAEDVTNNDGKILGSGFVAGTVILVTGNISYVSHVDVDSGTIDLIINNLSPGAATVQVQNPDGKTSNVMPLTIATELAAEINHVDMVPSTSGVSATLYIYGENLLPPGVVLAFTGFTPSGPPTHHTASYIEQDGTITAVAGADVLLSITSTSHSYLNLFLAKATASPGGAVIIESIDNREPKDNQSGFLVTVFGQNMDQVVYVEVVPTDPDGLALAYQPVGPDIAVTASVVSKTTEHVTLSLTLDKGLAYNKFDFNFYDAGLILLATAPEAIETQPSDDAPDITKSERAVLDGNSSLLPAGGSWSIIIPVDYVFGDTIVEDGWTPDGAPVYASGHWTIKGINNIAPGTNWQISIVRLASAELAAYRIPGGVTT